MGDVSLAALADTCGNGAVVEPDVLRTDGTPVSGALVWAQRRRGCVRGLPRRRNGARGVRRRYALERFAPDEPRRIAISWKTRATGIRALTLPRDPAAVPWDLLDLNPVSEGESLSAGDLDVISIGWFNPKLWIFENQAGDAA